MLMPAAATLVMHMMRREGSEFWAAQQLAQFLQRTDAQ